jgi:hypothetical protein
LPPIKRLVVFLGARRVCPVRATNGARLTAKPTRKESERTRAASALGTGLPRLPLHFAFAVLKSNRNIAGFARWAA